MQMINKYALAPLDPADVFSFKVTMAANWVDRDHEVFPVKTLERLQKLFIGRTVVKDHDPRSDNQIARIFETYLQQDTDSITPAGEIYTQLIAKCYMIKTASNADLIAEINAGIRKEVSLGCKIAKAVCSVCGTDNAKSYCKHFPGQTYDEKTCFFMLEQPKDAYELSFVAIPAQREAGTVKSYGSEPISLEQMQAGACANAEKDLEAPDEAAEQVEKASQGNADDKRLTLIYETVKSLVTKMDDFIAEVVQNNREARSGETADFSDVLNIAQAIDEAQASSQMSAAESQADAQDCSMEEAGSSGEPHKAPLDSQMSEESKVSQGSKAPESTDSCSKAGVEPDVSSRANDEPLENANKEADQAQSAEASKAHEAERLAMARLRNLDLSISLLSK